MTSTPPVRALNERSTSIAVLACSVLLAACRSTSSEPAALRAPSPTDATAVAAEDPGGAEVDEASTDPTDPADAQLEPSQGGLRLDGSLSVRYRMRAGEGESDHDLYSVLALDVGETGRDRVSARVLARFSADLGGRGDQDAQALFGSLQDVYDDPVHLDVYEASLAFERPFDTPLRLRAGRQIDGNTPEYAHFDGLRLESFATEQREVVGGAYAGVPVRIYDATSAGDLLAGAWLQGRPWRSGRARLDWMHVEQDESARELSNDLVALTLDQRFGEQLSLRGRYSRLEERGRDLDLRATWSDPEAEALVQASFYRLLSTQDDLVWEFDPFTATLQEYRPYDQLRLLVSKQVATHLRLDLGGDVRRLDEQADESQFNRDWERGFVTAVLTSLAREGLDLSLTADLWSSDERDVSTWGGDLSYDEGGSWRASIGSFYTLYKVDFLDQRERSDVRVYYARLRRRVGQALSLDLRYDYEDGDTGDFHTLATGATWHF